MRDLRRIIFWTVVFGFILGIFFGDNGYVFGFIASVVMHYWRKSRG